MAHNYGMSWWKRNASAPWETYAVVDRGDHGMGAKRSDPHRVGYLTVGDEVEWSPRAGDGWKVATSRLRVNTAHRLFGFILDGVEVEHPVLGVVRIRALNYSPDEVTHAGDAANTGGLRNGRLRAELLRRGAHEAPPGERV